MIDLVGMVGLAWSVCLVWFDLVRLIYKVWLVWIKMSELYVVTFCHDD